MLDHRHAPPWPIDRYVAVVDNIVLRLSMIRRILKILRIVDSSKIFLSRVLSISDNYELTRQLAATSAKLIPGIGKFANSFSRIPTTFSNLISPAWSQHLPLSLSGKKIVSQPRSLNFHRAANFQLINSNS